MHTPASSRSRARRGVTALLLLPLLLVLAGCFRLDMGLTITEDETVDVSMEVADLTGTLSRDDMDCATLGSQMTQAPDDVEFTVEDLEDDEGNLGCRIAAVDAPLDTLTGDGMSIEKVDDTYAFSFDGDQTGMADSAPEDVPDGMEPQVTIAVTFPGEVIEADGEVDGNTVTWSGVEALTAGGSATGYATGSGAGAVSTAVWVVLGVVALIALAALLYVISRRKRGSSGPGEATAPYGGPAGAQPGQVANDPGPGFTGQPGAGQPVGGFGPTDQVPADPGPGYPGTGQPSTADPFTTAIADAPVDRPEGSPFAPSPEPPAQPEQQDPDGDQRR